MFSANIPSSVANRAIVLTISTDQASSYNVFTAASSPSDSVDITLTINSAIKVSQMRALSFAPGSRIFIINNGFIYGAGGQGGGGASIAGVGSYGTGVSGIAGTDALQSNCRLIITNASGIIYGGGGGGVGGSCGSQLANGGGIGCGGGGGGGGQGYPGGAGGAGGGGYTASGSVGGTGNTIAVGSGAVGGFSSGTSGAQGAIGGGWALAGVNTEAAAATPFAPTGLNGGASSAGGRAIFTNGGGVTWISGAANVAGTVS